VKLHFKTLIYDRRNTVNSNTSLNASAIIGYVTTISYARKLLMIFALVRGVVL